MTTPEKVFGALVLLCSFVFQLIAQRGLSHDLLDIGVAGLFSVLWAVCLFGCWFAWKAGYALYSEVPLDEPKPMLRYTGSLPTPQRPSVWVMLIGPLVLNALFVTVIIVSARYVPPMSSTAKAAVDSASADRFSKAVNQLGVNYEPTRIAGVYALESLAKDSQKDHWPVVELLTQVLKKEAPVLPDEAVPPQPIPLSPEVQAILTVLGRRSMVSSENQNQRLDLGVLNLHNANLNDGHFERAFFADTNLFGALINRAHLEGADLRATDLSLVEFADAHLEKVNLTGSLLLQAHARGAYFSDAILIGTNLREADLQNAHLDGAVLCADLKGATLRGASFKGTNLSIKIEKGLDIDMAGISRLKRNPSGRTEIAGADVTGADLTRANLKGVDLSDVIGLTRDQMLLAITDETTILPRNLRR